VFGLRSWVLTAALVIAASPGARAGEGAFGWLSGDWYLNVGVTGFAAPKFDGDKSYLFSAQPIISLGRAGPKARFSSRNDGISFALVDDGGVRAGLAGKLVFPRDGDTADEIRGLSPIRFGAEAGGFFEFYPTDWMRARAELRHGIRAHDGIVADIALDAFYDVTPTVRVSAGPRVSFASADYFEAYYGVDGAESLASGLAQYTPDGGVKSAGVGGAINWQTTEKLSTSVFGEYSRLMGPAADSSLVRERGSPNQLMLGVSATYRFDFSL